MTTIFFGDGNDDWEPSENDELLNEEDEWHGGGGDDILKGDLYGSVGSGAAIDLLFGDAGNDILTGGGGADELRGGSDNDQLFGDARDLTQVDPLIQLGDRLFGEGGDDTLSGQGGDDFLVGGAGADIISGGDGIDTADYSRSTVGVRVLIGIEARFGEAEGDQVSTDVENLIGSLFNDVMLGTPADNLLQGLDGDDFLYGDAGVDTFYGGDGNDTMFGGAGGDGFYGSGGTRDRVSYFAQTEGVFLRIGVGTAIGGDATGDFISLSTEGIEGSNVGGDVIFGSAANNFLIGAGGDDILSGGGGGDELDGGEGIDEASYLDATAGVRADLLANIQNTGDAAGDSYFGIENLSGTMFADALLGSEGDNRIEGREGGDELVGRGGNDTLNGGVGLDSLNGSDGDDTYILDDVTVSGSLGTARYDTVTESFADGGSDLVLINANAIQGLALVPGYTLGTNVENATAYGTADFRLTGNLSNNALTGNTAANVLTGLSGNDRLDGGEGADELRGGDGNDTYVLGDIFRPDPNAVTRYDTVVEAANGGTDTLLIMSGIGKLGYTLDTEVENGSVLGNSAFALTGNALRNRLEGNGAENTLNGLGGADVLDGDGGEDVLAGGDGNDLYILTDVWGTGPFTKGSYDTVVELAGGGTDTIRVGAAGTFRKYTLGANIENGIIAEGASFSLFGTEFNNSLTGNDQQNSLGGRGGSDTLSGEAGNDSLNGGSGNDVLNGGAGGDRLNGGGGSDTFVYRFISDSPAGAPADGRDQILDFTAGDIIDLSVIDARFTTAGEQAFNFIGGSAFSAEGQIRVVQLAAGTEIQINISNGQPGAEMLILLRGVNAGAISAASFDL